MAEIRPPTVSLAGSRTRLRPFRAGDAANIAESCADSAIPRYTLMPEDMTEADARQWIERRSELWSHGLCSFAITLHPDDVCVGQMGVHIEIEQRRPSTGSTVASAVGASRPRRSTQSQGGYSTVTAFCERT